MGNNELLMLMYRMGRQQGCLVLKLQGKRPFKILKILQPLYFIGWLKQLSMAINTGAGQRCCCCIRCTDGVESLLKCSFIREIVALEFLVLKKVKLHWQGTAREFAAAVDRMILRMPGFF